MNGPRSVTWLVGIGCCAVIAACGGGGGAGGADTNAAATTSPHAATTDPVGLVALGHSGLTGTHSEPGDPEAEAPYNSWATGGTPAVRSIYLRMVDALPQTKGHVDNVAVNGATSDQLIPQAKTALSAVPHPRLVIIQSIDNDIQCDGTDPSRYADVAAQVKTAMQIVVSASPKSKILLLSSVGRPLEFAQAVQGNPSFRLASEDGTPCALFDDRGRLSRAKIGRLNGIVVGYESAFRSVCAQASQCVWDGGRAGRFHDRAEWMAFDGHHFNDKGHAAFAAWMWPTVATTLGVNP